MIKIRIKDLELVKANRPDGYIEDIISKGTIEGNLLFLDDDAYAEFRKKYAQSRSQNIHQVKVPIVPIKSEPWPLLLIPLKALAKEGDRGAGDIIARTVGPIGGEAFKKWYKLLFGKDCGCGNRQDALNRRWPL